MCPNGTTADPVRPVDDCLIYIHFSPTTVLKLKLSEFEAFWSCDSFRLKFESKRVVLVFSQSNSCGTDDLGESVRSATFDNEIVVYIKYIGPATTSNDRDDALAKTYAYFVYLLRRNNNPTKIKVHVIVFEWLRLCYKGKFHS